MSQYFVSVSHILYKEEYKHGTVQYISIQYVTTREDSLIHSREYKGLLEVGNLFVFVICVMTSQVFNHIKNKVFQWGCDNMHLSTRGTKV